MTDKHHLNPMVEEATIESILTEFQTQPDALEIHIATIQKKQAILYHWLMSENFDILTNEEKDHLIFLSMIIWNACEKTFGELAHVEERHIESAEESNWEVFLNTKGKFRERLNVFFEEYPQEDLLAFVEDALIIEEDEEAFLTNVGREIIFISMKTLIDIFCLN